MIEQYFKPIRSNSRNLSLYTDGDVPFVSNTKLNNGVVKYVTADLEKEVIKQVPCIAVNGFGYATIQTKPFIGSGNGGVYITALIPRKPMHIIELAYYAAQINLQSWRFSYGRRAIKRRLLGQIIINEFNLSEIESKNLENEMKEKVMRSFSTMFE